MLLGRCEIAHAYWVTGVYISQTYAIAATQSAVVGRGRWALPRYMRHAPKPMARAMLKIT